MMKNISNNKILSALGILAVFALGFMVLLPGTALANPIYINGYDYGPYPAPNPIPGPSDEGTTTTTTQSNSGTTSGSTTSATTQNSLSGNGSNSGSNSQYPAYNAAPVIYSITPEWTKPGAGAGSIDINGNNFIPSSIARFNDTDRVTAYVSPTHLIINLTAADVANPAKNSILVFTPAPGGGYSNGVIFAVGNGPAANGAMTVTPMTGASLGANASNSFVPGGFIAWLFLAILIFIAVILWRRYYVRKKEEEEGTEIPLKHA